jgi:uncharacterized protein YlxP (DUF503 family)
MPATIGVLTVEIRVEDSHSLKEKRHVVKSLTERLKSKFNVAVAEIDGQETWQWSVIAATTVSAERSHCEKMLRTVEDECAAQLGGFMVRADMEFF